MLPGNHAALATDLQVMALGAQHIAQQAEALHARIAEFKDRHPSLTSHLAFLSTVRYLATGTSAELTHCSRVEAEMGKRTDPRSLLTASDRKQAQEASSRA